MESNEAESDVAVNVNGLNTEDISKSYPDLTEAEKRVLITIRRRKVQLMREISALKEELSDVNAEIDASDSEEGAKARNLQMGKKKFNMDPKKGVEFLVGHDLVRKTPKDVAQFLYKVI